MRPDLFVCCLETRFLRDWARCEAFWRKVQQKICGLLPGLLPQPPCSAEWQGRRRTHQCKGSSSMSCFVFLPLTSKKIPWQINLGEAKMIPFCHEQQWDPDRLGQSHCRICLPWYFGVPKTFVWGQGLCWHASVCQKLRLLGNLWFRGTGNGECVSAKFSIPVKVLLVDD